MSTVGKLSREEWRKQKDLDAARKAGTAPAEIGEDGEVINPHVPDYMSKAPWYLDTGKRSLKHQRKPETGEKFAGINDWYQRGVKEGSAATKYRKGACENCGATSHKTRDCLERPRKKGAKWTNKDIAPDEYVADLGDKKLDFAAKRDRWNGYDPAEHKRIMEEYEAVEEERRRLREEEIDKQTSTDISAAKKIAKKDKAKAAAKAAKDDADFSSEDDEDEDEDKYAEAANMAGQKVDTDNRMSIRNLRIREDRAKYLYNLNPDSAYYDPKTRSMREAPDANVRPEDSQFAGDNFHRAKGDAVAMQRLQLFAWQAEARGNDVHLQANPTVNEKQFREFQQKKEKLRESTRGSILDKYGGAEHFESVPKELLQGQTENYVEYSRAGQIIKGQERAKAKSRFEEDVYDNNHTAVWGSWYDLTTGQWGYKCCHSTIPNSYCTGQAGIEASKASAAHAAPPAAATTTSATDTSGKGKGKEKAVGEKEAPVEEAAAGSKRRRAASPSASVSSASSSASSRSFSASDSDFSATNSDSEGEEDRRRSKRRSGSGRKSRGRDRSSRRDSTSKRRKGSHKSSRSRRRSYSSGSESASESESESDDGGRHRSGKSKTATGYVSRKHLGEGDVSSRLDKAKLKEALAREDARHNGKDKSREKGEDKKAAKPDWLVEVEMINSGKVLGGKVRSNRLGADGEDEAEAEDAEVTEEQMEAYRLKSRNAYEDPMASYKDEEDQKGA